MVSYWNICLKIINSFLLQYCLQKYVASVTRALFCFNKKLSKTFIWQSLFNRKLLLKKMRWSFCLFINWQWSKIPIPTIVMNKRFFKFADNIILLNTILKLPTGLVHKWRHGLRGEGLKYLVMTILLKCMIMVCGLC